MGNLRVEIHHIKNINNGVLEFPIGHGIYCLAGSNGCGKSTVMSCLAQSVFSSSLNKLNHEANVTNTFGIGTKIFSILDGDIQNDVSKVYKAFSKLFLPIESIEKYLLKVVTDPIYKQIKKEINDYFFSIESLDSILADYYKDGDSNGKQLYQKLRANLEKGRISEDAFIKDLCSIIMKYTDFKSFESSLTSLLSK